jgi:tetratricopeptide (TPR) repeat protein
VELCYLAQEVSDFEKNSPEVWCVIGNCFSLQKEHETAIKFFQRAIQIDPSFTYAYTLSGHEYVSNEDFEKAVACYRHAILCTHCTVLYCTHCTVLTVLHSIAGTLSAPTAGTTTHGTPLCTALYSYAVLIILYSCTAP